MEERNKKEKWASELGYTANKDWEVTNKHGVSMYVNSDTSVGGNVGITKGYKRTNVGVVRLFAYQHLGEKLYTLGRVRVIDQSKPLTMANLKFGDPVEGKELLIDNRLKKLSKQAAKVAAISKTLEKESHLLNSMLEGI